MSQELTKNLMCIAIRGGVEVWIDSEKLNELQKELEKRKFIKVGGEIINSVDISGVFKAQTMEDRTHRKNGEWKCRHEEWHGRGEKCDCEIKIPEYAKK